MRKPKFIRRIQDWFIKSKSDLPKTEQPVFKLDAPFVPVFVPSVPPVNTIPPKPLQKFPILLLPFLAQKNVLWMLKLNVLIPLSFLSKRSKRMIKQALPSKKTQYDCTVWSKEFLMINISSRFGSYTGFEPNIDHIIELLSYPFIRVVVHGDAVNRAADWVKTHQHCVKEIACYITTTPPPPSIILNYEKILEFINSFIEFNVRIELDRGIALVCSKEEVRIENPTYALIKHFWHLKCRKIRIVDRDSPYLAEMFMSTLASSDICEPSIVEQMVFELNDYNEINWTRLRNGKKMEEELQHPTYGKINEYYKTCHVSRKVILFLTHHNGKKLLVVDIEPYAPDALDSGLVT